MQEEGKKLVKVQQHTEIEKNAIMYKMLSHSVPGRPGTEQFVPGHLLLPLSRDKGTLGQENFFVPGQTHKTSRLMETVV